MLYGAAEYPGLFADSPGAIEGGPQRDAAIDAWKDRYLQVGLPFAIAAALTTFAWLLALGERWLLVTALAAAALLALVPVFEDAQPVLGLFLVPVFLLLVIPWQAFAVVFVGLGVSALAFKPSRERLGLHVAALYVAFSVQVIFTTLSLWMSSGTFG